MMCEDKRVFSCHKDRWDAIWYVAGRVWMGEAYLMSWCAPFSTLHPTHSYNVSGMGNWAAAPPSSPLGGTWTAS